MSWTVKQIEEMLAEARSAAEKVLTCWKGGDFPGLLELTQPTWRSTKADLLSSERGEDPAGRWIVSNYTWPKGDSEFVHFEILSAKVIELPWPMVDVVVRLTVRNHFGTSPPEAQYDVPLRMVKELDAWWFNPVSGLRRTLVEVKEEAANGD